MRLFYYNRINVPGAYDSSSYGSKPLNAKEISELSSNPYVASVISGRITFTPDFNRVAYDLLVKGTPIREIFETHGVDPEILRNTRMWGFAQKLRANAVREEGFEDRRKLNSRKPAKQTREQTLEAQMEQQEHELAYTRQEVEFQKKNTWPIWRLRNDGNPSSARNGIRTHPTDHTTGHQPSENQHIVRNRQCFPFRVLPLVRSRTCTEKPEDNDRRNFDLILEASKYHGYAKGARSIHMRLLNKPGIIMNVKKIRRLMRKFHLFCPIRKANPYRRMAKALATSHVAPNVVNREFRQRARKVLLTDITYLYYKGGRCYLSTVLDAFTREVLAYQPSRDLKVNFVLETVDRLMKEHGFTLDNETIVHSDQGCHYTSYAFINRLRDEAFVQSMSRRGNCWDNTPQESFFGHMKDEITDLPPKFCRNDQTVAPLAPPVFVAGFHCYYEAIRLLISRWVLSEISELQSPYPEWNGADQTSQVCTQYLVCSPCPIDPGGTCVSLHDRYALLPATQRTVSAST